MSDYSGMGKKLLIAEINRWKNIAANQKDQTNVAIEIAGERRIERDSLLAENESLRKAVNVDIEAAAKMLSSCMDYPWEHMPENGRDLMRRHAKDIVDAAISSPENP